MKISICSNENNEIVLSKKIFSILIILYPILNRYASFIPMLTISETLLFLFLVYFTLKENITLQKVYIPFVLYLILLLMFYSFSGDSSEKMYDNIGTILRVVFLYGALTIIGKGFINGRYAIKILNNVAIFMVIYSFIQWIGAKYGIYITTYIPGLPIMQANSDEIIAIQQESYNLTYRPYGLLNEPSALAAYLILPLTINLFSKIQIRYRIIKALILSMGCVICMSSTGIIICSIIWIYFLFFHKSNALILSKRYIFILLLFIIFVIPYTEIWNTFSQRTLSGGNLTDFNVTNTTRFYAISHLKTIFTNIPDLLFGVGMAKTNFYLPGFFRVFYTLGLVGFVIISLQIIYLYIKGDKLQKRITVIYAILNLGTEILLGNFALYYLIFINAEQKEIE